MFNRAPYFQASAVTDLATRAALAFIISPASSPELNPVEGCWRQLQVALSNRFVESLTELTKAIDTALDQLSVPRVSNYFYFLLWQQPSSRARSPTKSKNGITVEDLHIEDVTSLIFSYPQPLKTSEDPTALDSSL